MVRHFHYKTSTINYVGFNILLKKNLAVYDEEKCSNVHVVDRQECYVGSHKHKLATMAAVYRDFFFEMIGFTKVSAMPHHQNRRTACETFAKPMLFNDMFVIP